MSTTTTPARVTVRGSWGAPRDEHGIPADGAAAMIRDRKPFTAGHLSGELVTVRPVSYAVEVGELTDEAAAAFIVANQAIGPELFLYVVRSYETPIMWALQGRTATMPRTRYSVTTSKHQGITRWALTGQGVRHIGTDERRRQDGGRSPYGPQGGGW